MKNQVLDSCAEYTLTIKKTGKTVLISKESITSSRQAAEIARALYGDDIQIYESFYIIALNRANQPKGWAKISSGGIAGTVVDPILVAKYTIDLCATGIILVHNHPSGALTASQADLQITNKIKQALAFFDITVIDHIILPGEGSGFYSFAEDNKI